MPISTASNFWIEAGSMSGGSRNQIEFTDDLTKFFDPQSRSTGAVLIYFSKDVKAKCNLVHREHEFEQWSDIWRLDLITEAKGGPAYSDRVIHFDKRKVGKTYTYVTRVVDTGSAEHQALRQASAQVGKTGGLQGREYGYW